MNLYIRYFNDEVIVSNVDEAVGFLKSLNIEDFDVNDDFVKELTDYVDSDSNFPKRYKVKTHYYFIVIKTNASNLDEFKRHNLKSLIESDNTQQKNPSKSHALTDELNGWYDSQLQFKRVVCDPVTGKSSYRDTTFRALVKARSAMHSYERIVDYLRSRSDIDSRSQFPAAKGKSFTFSYVGENKPEDFSLAEK